MDLTISSAARDTVFTVLTYDGLRVPAKISADGKITFTLVEREDAISVTGVTKQDQVDVTYHSRTLAQGSGAPIRALLRVGNRVWSLCGLAALWLL